MFQFSVFWIKYYGGPGASYGGMRNVKKLSWILEVMILSAVSWNILYWVFYLSLILHIANWWLFESAVKSKGMENSWSWCAPIFLSWGSMGIIQRVECVRCGSSIVIEWKWFYQTILCSFLIGYTVVHRLA